MGGIFGGSAKTTSTSSISPATALQIQTSMAGVALNIVLGTNRIGGNLIDYCDFQAVAQQSSTESSDGKGGGGKSSSQTTGYKYYATVLIGLAEGPVQGILNVWDGDTLKGGLGSIGASLVPGQSGQAPWSYMLAGGSASQDQIIAAIFGQGPWPGGAHPDRALGYTDLAYVCAANMDLGDSASVPNLSFELCGGLAQSLGGDAPPAAAIEYLLLDQKIGAAWNSALIGDLSLYATWCANLGIAVSPVLNSQTAVRDTITDLLDATQAAPFWSQGQLHIVPYGDAYPSAYTGDLDPVMSFDLDDFTPEDGEPPVKITRADPADLYNKFTIEYVERSNSYYTATVSADDPAHIDTYGPRSEGSKSWHWITSTETAQLVVDLRRNRQLGVAATYEFQIGEIAAVLEPMDIIALTEPSTGLDEYPVRITKIEEVSDGIFAITAEDVPGAMAYVASRPAPVLQGYSAEYGIAPGPVNPPVIFEPPDVLTTTGLEVWLALSGGPNWGGAQIHISIDGDSYKRIGTVKGPVRQGLLSATLPIGAAKDQVNTLAVDMSESRGELVSVSEISASALATLSYVDGELIAYETADLTGANQYELSGLRRGCHGTTIAQHPKSAAFAVLDQTVFKYPFTPDYIGRTLSLKFVSFNIFEGADEDIADVQAYSYTLRGTALASPLPDVQGLATAFVAGITNLTWQAVSDFRAVDYEIRMGANPTSGQVIGRTTLTQAPSYGDGTYWVAAHYQIPGGLDVYSEDWTQIVIAGSQLTTNVLAGWDEAATSWGGSVAGAAIIAGIVRNQPAGDISTAADVSQIADISAFGGILGAASYTVPVAHRVDAGRVVAASVLMSVSARGVSIFDDISKVADVSQIVDVSGSNLAPSISAVPQIRLSQDGTSWGTWQDWIPGSYLARAFDFRVLLNTADSTVIPELAGFSFTVDVPDRTDAFTNLAVPATGFALSFASPFNGGPAGAVAPNVQYSIVNPQPGDDLILSAVSLSGLSGQVVNGGVGVARTISLLIQGY